MIDWFYFTYGVKKWLIDDQATALAEAAMLLPPMLTLMMGIFDLGTGIVLSQKTITSSQIAADLVARDRTVDSAAVEEVIDASQLAFEPYLLHAFGIDIASIQFDNNRNPVVLWRVTRDMSPNTEAVASVAGLSNPGEGMIIVTTKYSYTPYFSKFFTGDLDFTEVAFSRGRRSPTVTWE